MITGEPTARPRFFSTVGDVAVDPPRTMTLELLAVNSMSALSLSSKRLRIYVASDEPSMIPTSFASMRHPSTYTESTDELGAACTPNLQCRISQSLTLLPFAPLPYRTPCSRYVKSQSLTVLE